MASRRGVLRKVFTCEVCEVEKFSKKSQKGVVRVLIRLPKGLIAKFFLPLEICPKPACVVGGAFQLETRTFPAEDMRKCFKELFRDLDREDKVKRGKS